MMLDAGQAQLSIGLAWWYRKYAKEQSPEVRGRYEFEEQEARARRVGLWGDPDSVPPVESATHSGLMTLVIVVSAS